jgi:hypothetical protein
MPNLIEERRALSTANRGRLLELLAAAGDEGMRPGDLYAAATLPARTGAERVAGLVEEGLAVRVGKSRVIATTAGRTEARAGTATVGAALDAALALLPAEAMRAFVRLTASDVIARSHLRSVYPDGWGCFVAVGPTKTGKTAMARLVASLFGLDPVATIHRAPVQSVGSLWGRRERDDAGWHFVPSPYLDQPYLCIDELDKAEGALRRALLRLVQGDVRVAGEEGEVADVAPTVWLCANGGPDLVPVEYRRRAVVLDTAPLEPLLGDVHRPMRQLFGGAIPRLALGRLVPPATEVPGDVVDELLAVLREGLTPAGWRQLDDRAVEKLVLGRAALGRLELRQAALDTAADYLACAGTVGERAAGTPATLRQRGPGGLRPDVEVSAHEGTTPAIREAERRAEELAVARARAEASQRVAQALQLLDLRRVPERWKPQASGLAAVLRKHKERIDAQRSVDGLRAAIDEAAPHAQEAAALLAEVDRERTEAERKRMQAHDEVRQRREAEKRQRAERAQAKAEAKAEASRRVDHLRAQAKPLEKLYARKTTPRGGRPDRELAAMVVDGRPILTAVVASDGRTPLWVSAFDRNVYFAAAEGACPALQRWGPQTRAMLAPALQYLHRWEDQAVRYAGRKARTKRPSV